MSMPEVADITIPEDHEGLEELLNSPAFGEIANSEDPSKMAEFLTAYTKASAEKDAGIVEQENIEKQRAMAKLLADAGIDPNRNPIITPEALETGALRGGAPARLSPEQARAFNAIYNTEAPGAEADQVFDNSGQFVQATWHNADRLANAADLMARRGQLAEVQNAYTSQIGADGGFLIPETMRAELLSVALGQSVVRPRARVLPMSTSRMAIPTIDETSRESSVFGGVVAYWTEEQAAAVESGAKFGQVSLESKTLTAYTEVPNETMMDAMFFGAFFDQTFPQAIAHFEDTAFISGSGAGEPLGYLNSKAMVTVAKEGGQSADSILWKNLTKMYSRMLPSSINSSVWVVSQDAFPELAEVQSPNGTGIWMGEGSGQNAPPARILGRPVITTDKVPSVGDKHDISLVDFGYYLIGDRQMMTASSSEHHKFRDRKTSFLITERVDGRPWLTQAITPQNGSAKLSAFVGLAERA